MITVILQTHRRPENIPIMLKRIREQTEKVERILLWNDFDERKINLNFPGVECINSDSNKWFGFPQMVLGYFATTEYLAIMDDDVPPGPEWFKFAKEKLIKLNSPVGGFGTRFYRLKPFERYNWRSDEFLQESELEVDMLGQSYFLKSDWILALFRERPPLWDHCIDLHLSYTLQKYLGLNKYVISPGKKRNLACSIYNLEELIVSPFQKAISIPAGPHLKTRQEYLLQAVERGFKLKWLKS